MDTTAYGVWSLVLQLSSYVGYLDFGIQTAVGRFVAHANEFNDAQQRDRIVSTSFAMLAGSAVLAMILVLVLAWQLPNLFRDMPANLRADARLSLLFIGGSLAVGLPFSVFNGIFIGLQRYEVPAAIIGGGKLIGAAVVVMVEDSAVAWH
jgi:O-antigen/teichoic acid export membrane protein